MSVPKAEHLKWIKQAIGNVGAYPLKNFARHEAVFKSSGVGTFVLITVSSEIWGRKPRVAKK